MRVLCVLMICAFSAVAGDESLEGRWLGALEVQGTKLRIAFDVKMEDGSLTGSMDSLDQNAFGIPITVTATDETVVFVCDAVKGRFEGSRQDDALVGHWSQGPGKLPMKLERVAEGQAAPAGLEVTAAQAEMLVGSWFGKLNAGGAMLRLVLNIEKAPDGSLTASLDSPDQGAKGIPAKLVTVGEEIVWKVPVVNGTYTGTLEGDTMRGTWNQGADLPLDLTRTDGSEEIAPKRSQVPEKPYPYREEEVRFENEDAGIELAGTLTLPEGSGPFPAVVLVSGSGPQDRDETLLGHKPFLVLADHLTRAGIAVLRYDDRGTAASEGDFAMATTEDFAGDALAAVAFLKARKDMGAIGIVGHSEGGVVAPMAANSSEMVDFVVLLAGTAVTGEAILYEQSALILRANGADEALLRVNREAQESIFAIVKETIPSEEKAEKIAARMRVAREQMTPQQQALLGINDQVIAAQSMNMAAPWFSFFLQYDPAEALRRLNVPTLALFGEKDLQVPPSQNSALMGEALSKAGVPHKIQVLQDLNHLFQTSQTGSPNEYGAIEETFAPAALEIVRDWILETSR